MTIEAICIYKQNKIIIIFLYIRFKQPFVVFTPRNSVNSLALVQAKIQCPIAVTPSQNVQCQLILTLSNLTKPGVNKRSNLLRVWTCVHTSKWRQVQTKQALRWFGSVPNAPWCNKIRDVKSTRPKCQKHIFFGLEVSYSYFKNILHKSCTYRERYP